MAQTDGSADQRWLVALYAPGLCLFPGREKNSAGTDDPRPQFFRAYRLSRLAKKAEVPAGIREEVIYNGVRVEEVKGSSNETGEKPYLFSIGLHPKKNYVVALPILVSNPGYQWIIAGADDKGYQAELEKAAAKQGVADRLKFTGTVTEAEKWRLYQHCSALLFPSLSEGFGLPVLEAMSFGKPVFLSDRTSLPEIGGEAAYYFKNFAEEHIQQVFFEGMEDYKNDPEKPQQLKNRAATFTWDNAAKDYLKFYQSIL